MGVHNVQMVTLAAREQHHLPLPIVQRATYVPKEVLLVVKRCAQEERTRIGPICGEQKIVPLVPLGFIVPEETLLSAVVVRLATIAPLKPRRRLVIHVQREHTQVLLICTTLLSALIVQPEATALVVFPRRQVVLPVHMAQQKTWYLGHPRTLIRAQRVLLVTCALQEAQQLLNVVLALTPLKAQVHVVPVLQGTTVVVIQRLIRVCTVEAVIGVMQVMKLVCASTAHIVLKA